MLCTVRSIRTGSRYRQFCMVILFGVKFGSPDVFKPKDLSPAEEEAEEMARAARALAKKQERAVALAARKQERAAAKVANGIAAAEAKAAKDAKEAEKKADKAAKEVRCPHACHPRPPPCLLIVTLIKV